jgi:hypothetical protein
MKKLLLVPLALILFAAPMAVDLLVEGFENDTGDPPVGWHVEEEAPWYYSWYFWYYPGSGEGHGGSDGYANHYGYDYYYNVDSWLVSPELDMSGYENLSFSIWHSGYGVELYNGTFIMGTDVAAPDTGDFVELAELGAPPWHPSWEEVTADASAFDNESNVTFAIRYIGLGGNGLYIDDVLVTGDEIVGIESASLGEIKAIYK